MKIEAYVREKCGGQIRAAYGCSLGDSFVGLLAARGSPLEMTLTRWEQFCFAMGDLAKRQGGVVHSVEIEDTDGENPGRKEIETERRPTVENDHRTALLMPFETF